MKMFDIRSALVGALLAVVMVFSVAAATGASTRTVWQYKVVSGPVAGSHFEEAINSKVAEGWEFVSADGTGADGCFAVLKREKK